MSAYWFFFALPAIGVLSPISLKKNIGVYLWFFLLLTYIFFIGFRYEVGGDWGTYIHTFNINKNFNPLNFNIRSDYAYELVSWISFQLGYGIYGTNLFCAVVFTIALFSFCSLQPNKWLALIVSFPVIILILGMGFTRQGVAFSFILLSLISLIKKQQIYFFIYIFIAVLFHKSSIVFLPIYLVSIEKNIIINVLFFIFFAIFTLFVVWEDLNQLYTTYIVGRLSNAAFGKALVSKGAYIRVSLNIFSAIIMIFFYNKISKNKIEKRIFLLFALASIVSIFFIQDFSVVTDRINLYIAILQVFVLSRMSFIFNNDDIVKLLNAFILLLYFVALIVWLNFGIYSYAWIPYMNLFFHTMPPMPTPIYIMPPMPLPQ